MPSEKKKKKKKKKQDGSKSSATDRQAGTGASGEDLTERRPSKKQRFWETYRVTIVGAIVVVVFTSAWTPARHWIAGATDEIHDAVLYATDFDGGRVDDMEERIASRPFWESGPHFQGASLDFLSDHLSGPPVGTLKEGSTSARVITVDELVENAPEFDGEPIVVVGKFFSNTLLGGDDLTLDREEVVVTGKRFYAYFAVGTGYGSIERSEYDGLVAALGVLVATGRAKATKSPEGVETAYFAAIESIPVERRDADLQWAIRKLTGPPAT